MSRVVRWVGRFLVWGAVLLVVWLLASYLGGRHYFVRGMRQLATDPAAATGNFRTAVLLRPRNAQYRAALGRAYLKQKDYAAAATHLKRAAQGRPGDYGLWHDLGEACLKANSPDGATDAFRKALEIRPQAERPLEGLAEAASLAGDWEAALQPLRSLWQRDSADLNVAENLATALVATGHYDETLKVCEKAKEQLGSNLGTAPFEHGQEPDAKWQAGCPFLVAEGDAYRAKGRWGDAVTAYLRCLAISHGHGAALLGLDTIPDDVVWRVCPDLFVRGPAFSPDGQKIAFYSTDGVYVEALDAGQPRRLAACGRRTPYERPAWSPDGQWLCYQNEHKLRIVRADGSGGRDLVSAQPQLPQLRHLWNPQAPLGAADAFPLASAPAWSPDGKRIAYRAQQDHSEGVTCVVEVGTGKAASVHRTTGTAPKYAAHQPPSWSRDGRVLCGALDYGPKGSPLPGVTVWSAAGEVKRQVPVPREASDRVVPRDAVLRAEWGPDARFLDVDLQGTREVNLAVVPSSGGRGKVVAHDVAASGAGGHHRRWLDSRHLWLLDRTGDNPLTAGVEALVSDLQGDLSKPQAPFPILPVGEWAVSPDGRTLVTSGLEFAPQGGQDTGLWVFDLWRMGGRG